MEHITNTELEALMEQFLHEHPYGDSLDLARFMFNHGYDKGMTETCELM